MTMMSMRSENDVGHLIIVRYTFFPPFLRLVSSPSTCSRRGSDVVVIAVSSSHDWPFVSWGMNVLYGTEVAEKLSCRTFLGQKTEKDHRGVRLSEIATSSPPPHISPRIYRDSRPHYPIIQSAIFSESRKRRTFSPFYDPFMSRILQVLLDDNSGHKSNEKPASARTHTQNYRIIPIQ